MWAPLEELETWDPTRVGGTQGALEAQGGGGRGPSLGNRSQLRDLLAGPCSPADEENRPRSQLGPAWATAACTPYPARQPLTSGLCRSGRPWGIS